MNVKLLTNLDFGVKINQSQAITEAGKEILNNYRSYVYSNPVTYNVVNRFIYEASKCNFDEGLANILESINKFISENKVSWKLATVCENILNNNSSYNYINKIGAQQVEKLLEMKEADVISYIKAGSLKGVQYIPEFRQICKEVYKNNITESKGINYTVYNPVSYVIVEGNTQYFQVLGKAFKISDGTIDECVIDNKEFATVNKLLEGFRKVNDKLVLEYTSCYNETAKFILDESTLTFEKGDIKEVFENTSTFNEYVSMVSKTMNTQEKFRFNSVASVASNILEHISNIVELDNVKVLNTVGSNVCTVISEGTNNVNVSMISTNMNEMTSKNYDYVIEALNDVVKMTGIDLKYLFEDRINEDCKKAEKDNKELKDQLDETKEEQYNIRKRKIAMLAEQFKNDPVKLMLLSKCAQDLASLEKK